MVFGHFPLGRVLWPLLMLPMTAYSLWIYLHGGVLCQRLLLLLGRPRMPGPRHTRPTPITASPSQGHSSPPSLATPRLRRGQKIDKKLSAIP